MALLLLVVIAALFPLFLGPILVTGGGGYPDGSWRIAVMFAASSALGWPPLSS